jgi:hypothetical protein
MGVISNRFEGELKSTLVVLKTVLANRLGPTGLFSPKSFPTEISESAASWSSSEREPGPRLPILATVPDANQMQSDAQELPKNRQRSGRIIAVIDELVSNYTLVTNVPDHKLTVRRCDVLDADGEDLLNPWNAPGHPSDNEPVSRGQTPRLRGPSGTPGAPLNRYVPDIGPRRDRQTPFGSWRLCTKGRAALHFLAR